MRRYIKRVLINYNSHGGSHAIFFQLMKNNYLITIGIFLPVLLTSCRSDQTIPTVIQETTTRPVVTEVLSDIIDTCKFIPLETASDKSLVGHISKILKYKDLGNFDKII